MPESVMVQLGHVQLELCADRAAFHLASRTLFIADLHLGKTAAFRASGIPAPESSTTSDLDRLSGVLRRTGAQHLVILGDFVHSAHWNTPAPREAFARWRELHTSLHISLVPGNHDAKAGALPQEWSIQALPEISDFEGISLLHNPDHAHPDRPSLAGHLHPGYTLKPRTSSRRHAGRSIKAPCFWLRGQTLILPAFAAFTGCLPIQPRPLDRIWLLGQAAIIEIPTPATTPTAQTRTEIA